MIELNSLSHDLPQSPNPCMKMTVFIFAVEVMGERAVEV
jgi:hypothetical protein